MKKSTLNNKLINAAVSGSIALMLVLGSALMTSCQSAKKENTPIEATSNALSIDAVLQQADQLAGQTIELEGVCTHICKHGGRKIFLMGDNASRILRIEAGTAGKFDPNCVNNIVKVTGVLAEERIDETYLQKWEASLAENTAESHGESEAGCSTEKKARGESANTPQMRIEQFRKRIAEQKEKTGKAYLSFYHLNAVSYTIQD